MLRILVLSLLFACGTDSASEAIPTLQADGNGVSVQKGEKGDKGEAGPQGPAGKDGTTGIDGKDGKDGLNGKDGTQGEKGPKGDTGATVEVDSAVWKDPITGRAFIYIQGKFAWAQAETICSTWRLPTPDELTGAVRRGLVQGLPLSNPASGSDEGAWSNSANLPWEQYGTYLTIPTGDTSLYASKVRFSRGISVLRVYCTRD
jgi:hypothetical protein